MILVTGGAGFIGSHVTDALTTDHDVSVLDDLSSGDRENVSSEAAFTPYYALNERDRGRLSFLAEIVLTEPEAASLPTGMPVETRLPEARNGP